MTMETILLAVDSSDEDRLPELIDAAADVAGDDTTVVTLHVFERDSYRDLQSAMNVDPDSETTPDDVARRYAVVRNVADALEARGVDTRVRGALGDGSDPILRVAREEDADHLVVGGRRRTPTGKAVFGSTAQQILLNATRPVTFVRAGTADPDVDDRAVASPN
ncbi:MAG: universal stress protein [Haloarculaceae archaeon]